MPVEHTILGQSRNALVSVDVEKAKCSTTSTVSVDLNMQPVYQVCEHIINDRILLPKYVQGN